MRRRTEPVNWRLRVLAAVVLSTVGGLGAYAFADPGSWSIVVAGATFGFALGMWAGIESLFDIPA